VKKLSDQLSALADRTKKTEDTVGAARDKDRQKLEAQRAAIKASADEHADSAKADVTGVKNKAGAKLEAARTSVDSHFAAMRDHAEKRRAEHDSKRAEHHADLAEQDACDAVDLALYTLDNAEYAIIDAAIARADADDAAKADAAMTEDAKTA
jgi:chromosome segregation ATPase